jgi:hypothetical protein
MFFPLKFYHLPDSNPPFASRQCSWFWAHFCTFPQNCRLEGLRREDPVLSVLLGLHAVIWGCAPPKTLGNSHKDIFAFATAIDFSQICPGGRHRTRSAIHPHRFNRFSPVHHPGVVDRGPRIPCVILDGVQKRAAEYVLFLLETIG